MSYDSPPPGNYGPPPPGGYGHSGAYGPPGGYGYNPQPPGEPPKNHLVLNILGIISCMPVIGIVGLVFAIMVRSQWMSGDYHGAQSSARLAKILGIIGTVLFVPVALYVLFMITGVIMVIVTET
ncbi:CD225/dispanin family protein [Nocardiopsis halotolerans]|uniref:CD225/dispanin family protein n=1 Tax=Nocardiopsis halotolerans TaxID=124252 RepID=UPI00034C5E2C|nr:CD225/dispanin family protein [Nocardiopsis halotolerans]